MNVPSDRSDDMTERLQINLEDDVRAFLLSRLMGNQLSPERRAHLRKLGVDVRSLSKPTYLSINSGCDEDDESADIRGCSVGAEGVMVHEAEAIIHLAFKCGDTDHEIHYTGFMPTSVIEMAKAMEAVWPGSIIGPLVEQSIELGRAKVGDSPGVVNFDDLTMSEEDTDDDVDGDDDAIDEIDDMEDELDL